MKFEKRKLLSSECQFCDGDAIIFSSSCQYTIRMMIRQTSFYYERHRVIIVERRLYWLCWPTGTSSLIYQQEDRAPENTYYTLLTFISRFLVILRTLNVLSLQIITIYYYYNFIDYKIKEYNLKQFRCYSYIAIVQDLQVFLISAIKEILNFISTFYYRNANNF